ncbi:MAG: hypothetical protein ACREC2_13625, partial [Bradyrhizobium sp.]
MGIAAGTRLARAQGSGNVQELPPIEVSGPKQSVKHGRDRTASRPVRPLKRVFIYPTTPLGGADADPDRVPASINAIDAGQIKQTGSLNISDALVKYVPGITINEVSGNPF